MPTPRPQRPTPGAPEHQRPGPQFYEDPRLHNVPQFQVPNEITDSVNRGVFLMGVGFNPSGVETKVLATDGSGFTRHVFMVGGHFHITTQCIGTDKQVFLVHREWVSGTFDANRHFLKTCIASLDEDVVVQQFYVSSVCNATIRNGPVDMDRYRKWREDVCSGFWSGGVTEGFIERLRSGKRRMRVEKFFAEYDGTELGEDDVLACLTWIQLVGPREIHFRPSENRESELRIRGVLMVPAWRAASKFTMHDEFWTELVPRHWKHFDESHINVKSVELTVLERLLKHFEMSSTFVFCTIRLKESSWDIGQLEAIRKRRLKLEVKENELFIKAIL